jgi:hypothetical protein
VAEFDPDKHCGAQKANRPPGDVCKRPSGWGTDHPGIGRCKRHGGSTPSHNEAARRELLIRDCKVLGLPLDIDPETALLEAVREAAGNVAFYRVMVQDLPQHPTPDEYFPPDDDNEDGKGRWERGESGIYGRTYHVSGLPTGEAKPHILVQLYNDERARMVQFASIAMQRGVAERLVKLAERDATAVAQAQIATLAAMHLTGRLEEFRKLFHEQLQSHIEPLSLSA